MKNILVTIAALFTGLLALFDKLGQYIPFLGLNTHGGLIFSYLGGIALHVWTIKGYFETIDNSLEEAAALEGKESE